MLVNTVFRLGEKTYRFLGVYDDKAMCFDMGSKGFSSQCEGVEFRDLLEMERSGKAEVISDPYLEQRQRKLEGKIKERAERNYSVIEPLIAKGANLMQGSLKGQLVKERAKHTGLTVATVYRLLRKWWLCGQSIGALAPSFGNNKGHRNYKKVPGRHSKNGKQPIIMTEEERKVFSEICRKYLLVPNYLSVTKAYQEYLTLCRKRGLEPASLNQFRYFYYSSYSAGERSCKRNSAIRYEKDLKRRTGTVYEVAIGPGSIYEIDSTLADIYLVSSDGQKVIGRPTLYVVTDTYSGMIVGVHVSLQASQYKVGAEALLIACTEKVSYCESLGLPIKESEWPCKGLPSQVVADNAEFSTDQIEHFAQAYSVTVTNTRPYRGDDKGTVESAIGQIQHELKSLVTGIPDKVKLKKAGGKDRRLEATLTLSEYRRVVTAAALIANRRVKRITPPGYPAQASPTPLAIWTWGKDKGKATLAEPTDEKLLKIMLLPRQKVTISRDGINANGIRYTCREAEDRGWLDRSSGIKRPKDLKMVIDPSDVGQAWLFPDPHKKPLSAWQCRLLGESSKLAGLSLEQARDHLAAAKAASKEAEQNKHEFASLVRESIQEVVSVSVDRDKTINPRKREKIKGIEQARREERFIDETAKRQSVKTCSVMSNLDRLELQTDDEEENFAYPENIEDIPK